ncbi:hypothetical protein B0T19DRAFT_482908 [Cercophora scortea]|uniref:Uncharacterized protein n=1 Tax=Cercophora scortea TaxID=314031 RepID=A0AAE0IX46_9PEZI|nr:hypothetical protein B0T19DRAFT_482908 [Cercophora scortea]
MASYGGHHAGTHAGYGGESHNESSGRFLKVPVDKINRPDSLYITMQYLRTVGGERKYHWALFLSERAPPNGLMMHATDLNRGPLDLYLEERKVSDPKKSRTMVVCMKIADLADRSAFEACASSVRLMDRRYLPRGEPQWTCRVWVKEVLLTLDRSRYIALPLTIDEIEQHCLETADSCIHMMGKAKVFNDFSWLRSSRAPTTPMEIESVNVAVVPRYYGPSPMETETHRDNRVDTRYYGPSPMETETHRGRSYYGPSPMETETHNAPVYYSSKPRVTESRYRSGR